MSEETTTKPVPAEMTDEEIRKILLRGDGLEENVESLIGTANENGGKDNIAVIMVRPDADEV